MINKYSGISLIILALLALVVSWGMYKKSKSTLYRAPQKQFQTQQLIREMNIKPEAFESLNVINEVIDTVSIFDEENLQNVSIALSPTTNKSKRPIVEFPTDKDKLKRIAANICRKARKLTISMSFISSDEKYAVIANKFVKEGELIGNKYEVVSIAKDKVRLRKNGVNCTVNVSSPNQVVARVNSHDK